MSMMIVLLAVFITGLLLLIIVQGARNRRVSLPEQARDTLDGANLLLSEDKPKHSPNVDLAAGIRDMLEAGQVDEAVEIYQKFTGVDQYSARDAVDEIQRELRLGDESTGYADNASLDEESRSLNGRQASDKKRID